MRILLIHNFYKSTHIGGEDLVFRREAEFLRGALGEESVLTYSIDNDRTPIPLMVFNLFLPILHVIKIGRLVRQEKIKVVHVHNEFPNLTLWIFRALRGTGCVRIQTLHNYRHWCLSGIFYRTEKGICEDCVTNCSDLPGVLHGCYRKSRIQSLIAFFARKLYRLFTLLDEVDAFFCLSEHQRKKLMNLGVKPERIHLKPNVVPPVSNEYGHGAKNIDLLYVGRLEESKGIFRVLDQLNQQTLQKLHVVGQSEVLDSIKARYPGVTFYGRLDHAEVMKLLSRTRYLLQPSLLYETFGLTIIEAMSQGVPVIGFSIGTRKDFIHQEVNGFFIHETTIQDDIDRALAHVDYATLSRNAKDFARSYEAEPILKRQIAIYHQLMSKVANNEISEHEH